jgi:hypothetical protein
VTHAGVDPSLCCPMVLLTDCDLSCNRWLLRSIVAMLMAVLRFTHHLQLAVIGLPHTFNLSLVCLTLSICHWSASHFQAVIGLPHTFNLSLVCLTLSICHWSASHFQSVIGLPHTFNLLPDLPCSTGCCCGVDPLQCGNHGQVKRLSKGCTSARSADDERVSPSGMWAEGALTASSCHVLSMFVFLSRWLSLCLFLKAS